MRSEVAVPPGAIQHGSRLASRPYTAQRTAGKLAAVTLLAAVAYGCLAQGGFYPDQQRTLLALVAASGVLAALAVPARRVLAHVAIAAPVCGCAVLTALAAGNARGAAPVLGIVGAATAAALVARAADRHTRDALLSGLVLAGVALAVSGWVGVAVRIDPLALVDQGLWRASSTLTYANATAALLAPLALVAIAKAAAEPDERRWRLAAVVLFVGVGATLSRAGWAGSIVGLGVLGWFIGWHKMRNALPVLVGAAIATAGVIAVAPDRLPSRPALAVATFAIGLAVSVVTVRHPRRWLAMGAVLVCAGIALGGAFSSSRLTVESPDRSNEWRATWAVVRDHPVAGVGPSNLVLEWPGAGGNTFAARATHNEFLQLAAEQGVPALVVALATLTLIGVALVRRHAPTGLAVLAAFVVASAFDFVWHMALIPIVVAALVGAAVPLYADQNSSL